MFLSIEKGGIVFTDNGNLPIVERDFAREPKPWSQPHSALCWHAPEPLWDRFLARVMRNENVFFDELDGAQRLKETRLEAPFYEYLAATQVHNAAWLRQRYDASPDEFMSMVEGGRRVFQPQLTDMRMSHLLYMDEPTLRNPTMWNYGLSWVTRSQALSWMIQNPYASMHPVHQYFGYGFEAARHMDTSIVAWPELDKYLGAPALIDLQRTVRGFIDHVNIAAKCALDTPQPVTLDYGARDRHTITFENRRLSSSVRGLHITLPTGGLVFLRGAELVPGSGAILHKGRAVPSRKIAMAIIEQTAFDLVVARVWRTRCGHIGRAFGLPEVTHLDEYAGWVKMAARPPTHIPAGPPMEARAPLPVWNS